MTKKTEKTEKKTAKETKKDKVINEILGKTETEGEEYNFYTEAQKRSEALAEIDSELTKEEKRVLDADAKRRFTTGS